MAEPMIISSPYHKERKNQATYSMTSLLDIVPTILDWFNISNTRRNESLMNHATSKIGLTGKSLLPLLVEGKRLRYHHRRPKIAKESLENKWTEFFNKRNCLLFYVPEVLNVHVNESKKKSIFFRKIFFPSSEKLTLGKKMWFFKIFFQISVDFIELWLIFCKFRSYERSELQVHCFFWSRTGGKWRSSLCEPNASWDNNVLSDASCKNKALEAHTQFKFQNAIPDRPGLLHIADFSSNSLNSSKFWNEAIMQKYWIYYCCFSFDHFKDILNRSRSHQPLRWSKTLQGYYERPEWELYDLKYDPEELTNVAGKSSTKVGNKFNNF